MGADLDLVHDSASRSLGLITRANLITLGVPDRTITRWRSSGRLRQVDAGVYLVVGAPWTWETRVLARCLAHDGAASHRTAAVLRGAPRLPRTTPEVIKAHGAHASGDPCVRRTRHLGDLDISRVGAIPTVGATPLALQLTTLVPRALSIDRFDGAVEHLVRAGLTSWPVLELAVAEGSRRRTPGIRHLREIVEEYASDSCESRLERAFLPFLEAHGLPIPVAQHPIVLPDGREVRVDYAYPELMVAIELDSLEYHALPDVLVDDREKRRRLRMAGWRVEEYTHRGLLRSGDVIAADLRQLLAERAAVA